MNSKKRLPVWGVLLIIFLCIGVALGCIYLYLYFTVGKGSSNFKRTGEIITTPIDNFLSKDLVKGDFAITHTQSAYKVRVTIEAKVDIDYIDVTLEYKDNNGLIISSETKRINNLRSRHSQSVDFKLGFFDSFSASKYEITTSGKRR